MEDRHRTGNASDRNLELSMSWKDGRITGAVFTAYSDVDTVVKYKETEKDCN